ncbi:PAS domain S-box protein [Pseudomonas sp. CCI3.2]|uniref:PAS domain-containing hybrid sensor histidine kinase/response regulator n=1 Tax=unclassified Pseudomonas TaxID=196821 RepID=UPI002AC9E74F|nr:MULTISPECIES: PAS domain S-box protein [unclassified Pseudomonas]MEB0078470.1 PAS domain S-box protein [Pseudomonas sp. MH10out]MEB0090124.1 PAS domain S-box protein [Pseudomonas sp. CCI4.2]MEB0103984.1 PAS domain S-box protein [Pseudomonas sp. CCI3.2]MEB0131747.1 PAS domain S-box protein [Pseudomonas sp. CCI2.4]MEB0158093.1 PAS domain S-box protein [Pseudomonas sp. AH2 (2023)]
MLNTHHPMYIFWGPESICIYNDAYRQSLGPELHPGSLGQAARQVWDEIWEVIGPQIVQVMSGGGATWHENHLVPITRHGRQDDVYWTYGFSPVDDEEIPSGIGGVLVVCTETTGQVLAERRAALENAVLSRLFEQAPTFMAMLRGREHRFELANPGYLQLIGHRPVVGRTVAEALPDAVEQGYLQLLDNVFDSGVAFSAIGASFAVQPVAGGPIDERFVDFVYQPIKDDHGNVTAIFVEGADVTVRVNADVALRESEARLRLVIEGAKDYAILTTDLEGRISTWSKGAESIFGWTAKEIIGLKSALLFSADDRACGIDVQERTIATREGSAADERWHVRKDGEYVYLNGSVHPLPLDAAGQPQGFLKIARNETSRRRAETLRESLVSLADRFRGLSDPTDITVAAAQLVGETLQVSRVGYGTFSIEAQALHIERCWSATGFKSPVEWLPLQHQAAHVEHLQRGEMVQIHDSKPETDSVEPLPTLVYAPVIEREALVAVLCIAHRLPRSWSAEELQFIQEVAERTRSAAERSSGEAALRSSEVRLREANESLEAKVEARTGELMKVEEALRQAQKMEAVGQLTGGVAHDFNNLLTVIKSSTDLLKRPNLTEEKRERFVSAISDTVDRAAKLTGQLLAFARRQALMPEVFDVNLGIKAIVDMVRALTGSRIEIITRFPTQACFVDADRSQFDTTLVNMAVNARDAMGAEGRLIISVSCVAQIPGIEAPPEGDFVAVSLEDTGTGISTEHMEQIFEPFFTTKDVGQGTGLGLSQVFGFAKQSGGEIHVRSALGKGSMFTLYLPRVACPPTSAVIAEPDVLVDGHGTGVLVVEDNEEVGSFAMQTLGELGYVAVWVANARDALTELAVDGMRFDVVFSDVIMPGMNGIDLAQEIRRRHPDLPVVLTSGYSHVLAQKGSYGFELLHKPYSVEQLSRVLRRAVVMRHRPAV